MPAASRLHRTRLYARTLLFAMRTQHQFANFLYIPRATAIPSRAHLFCIRIFAAHAPSVYARLLYDAGRADAALARRLTIYRAALAGHTATTRQTPPRIPFAYL